MVCANSVNSTFLSMSLILLQGRECLQTIAVMSWQKVVLSPTERDQKPDDPNQTDTGLLHDRLSLNDENR